MDLIGRGEVPRDETILRCAFLTWAQREHARREDGASKLSTQMHKPALSAIVLEHDGGFPRVRLIVAALHSNAANTHVLRICRDGNYAQVVQLQIRIMQGQ